MAEGNPVSHEQGPKIQEGVQQIVDAVNEALQGRQDAVDQARGDMDVANQAFSDASDRFHDARGVLREGGAEFAGELRIGGDALHTAADQLDPPVIVNTPDTPRFSKKTIKRIAIVGGAVLVSAIGISQIGGDEDKAPVNNGTPVPTQVTGATGQ